MIDDLGHRVVLPGPARRVVSLVPSLTEAVALSRPGALIAATDWCTRPADLDVARIRGTKNPDVKAIIALKPDIVLANKEENRELDINRLREAGIEVWVTVIETVEQACASMRRLFTDALRWDVPAWLDEVERLWLGPLPAIHMTVAIPIWRDPWMAVGSRTFTGDLVRHIGLANVFGQHENRYPHLNLADIDRADIDMVLLPDEPYVFTTEDGPEAFTHARTQLVSGRLLTWYGPSMIEAHHELVALLG